MLADPNTSDECGKTPLMEAACAGDFDLCCLLISHRADPAQDDHGGLTAAHYATHHATSHPEVLELLNGRRVWHFGVPARCRPTAHPTLVDFTLDRLEALITAWDLPAGVEVDQAVREFEEAVEAEPGRGGCGAALLAWNRDGQLLLDLCHCPTPGGGTADAVAWLIAARASVNVANALGETPLALAARCTASGGWPRGEDAVAALLAARADPNAGDRGGNTPLMEAYTAGHLGLCARLLAAGAEGLVALEHRI
eukprot:NODE_1746_length_1070_cov_309.187192.p1 GENE.NODE_1746_length_1070_cov_309.187192~~NODE_1746_length_1070_cov_309.187192.p1  ORF type:complete len:277 (+),score=73.43 NODE_1746_length_1070_cov_309.187192:71-832(+)